MLPKHPHITKPTHKNTPNVHGTFMPKNFFVTGLQLVKKFPAFYGTRRFITAFTNARHLSLSWASSIQSITPHHTFWRSILILPPPFAPGCPKWSLFLRLPHQHPVYASPLPHTRPPGLTITLILLTWRIWWANNACGRSPAEILGSNPTGGMDICLLWVSCVVR